MLHMRQTFFILTIFFIGLIFILRPSLVSAHAGGGPPFLLVNDKYAQTNPFFTGGSEISVAQDATYDKYLVNTPIHFKIDTPKLLLPPEIIESSTFRWSLTEGSTNYEYGTDLVHIYPKIGSYLATLEVKAASEPTFIVLDTVQIDVVPDMDYQLPTANIGVFDTLYKSNKPLHFQAQTTHDPSTSIATYDWVLGTSKQSGTDVSHTYTDQDFFEIVFLKVHDANGLSTDTAISVQGDKGSIALASLSPKDSNVPVIGTTKQTPIPLLIGAIIGIILLGCGIFIIFRRKQQAHSNL